MESSELYQEALSDVPRAARRGDACRRTGTDRDDAGHGRRQSGRVSARIVLLKSVDERGFAFYTNYHSAKAAQLAAQRAGGVVPPLEDACATRCRCAIEGAIEKSRRAANPTPTSPAVRRESQIGAWASLQSQTLPTRGDLDERIAEFEQQVCRRSGAATAALGRLPSRARHDRILVRPARAPARTGALRVAGDALEQAACCIRDDQFPVDWIVGCRQETVNSCRRRKHHAHPQSGNQLNDRSATHRLPDRGADRSAVRDRRAGSHRRHLRIHRAARRAHAGKNRKSRRSPARRSARSSSSNRISWSVFPTSRPTSRAN